MNYNSPIDLLAELEDILPGVAAEWRLDNSGSTSAGKSIHAIYGTFFYCLGRSQLTEQQAARVASFLNAAVAAGGNSENAASTVVLEHLSNNLKRTLRPYLSSDTKERIRNPSFGSHRRSSQAMRRR